MSKLSATSYLFGGNSVFIEELYNRYVENPASVDPNWQEFFADLGDDLHQVMKGVKGASWAPKGTQTIVGYIDPTAVAAKKPANDTDVVTAANDSIKALMLIRSYRIRGHLLANLDPLKLEEQKHHPDLDPATYGFTEADYDRPIYLGGSLGLESATLRDILGILYRTYCSNIGAEFMHIESLEQREWIEDKLEYLREQTSLSAEEKKNILKKIIQAESFEQFLHVKFPGTKRFSIEGGEATIPAMETVLATAAASGVNEVVLGMPHRGRLNVLTAIMGKPYAAMLSEFQGNLAHPEDLNISGDVKYHLGTSSDRKLADGHTLHLSLTANPSHLEAVNPVVAGKVRAKQDHYNDPERQTVMGLLLHGDAAFAGQGVVAETLLLGDLKGYTTGGTMHIIVNNQIGFTTSPKNARLSPYPTEVAKIVQAPIFHINGEDPEAVTFASKIATEFRNIFKKDVVLDIICYRRYGHNEGDEPFFTQPRMYTEIAGHKTPMHVYADKLIAEGVITQQEFEGMVGEFRSFLEKEHKASESYKPNKADWLSGKWTGLEKPKSAKNTAQTGVKKDILQKVGKVISAQPQVIKVHSKIARQLEAKQKMFETGKGFDWATGEALAFGTLLLEGFPVRMSGQDSRRGTFSQRHAVLVDQESEENYTPLNNIDEKQAKLEVIDSNLSEFAVLGFEYGYSLAEPNSLTLWEAQFGDFVNGAQVMIDQFIASSESKWLRLSGLVMLLPHGYEGQGPEHSSARLERFLQLCAEDNMQIANCTTPASYFHILRRQLHRKFRKPLVMMTPKSLLRHKLAVSELKEFEAGTSFQTVIPETQELVEDSKVKRLVLCSGKVYYDLFEEREKRGINDVAIARLEQLYPFAAAEVEALAKRYSNAEVIWCQEEPKNMGAWSFVDPLIEEVLVKVGGKAKRPRYVGRVSSASPAAGYLKIHNKEQAALVNEALTVK